MIFLIKYSNLYFINYDLLNIVVFHFNLFPSFLLIFYLLFLDSKMKLYFIFFLSLLLPLKSVFFLKRKNCVAAGLGKISFSVNREPKPVACDLLEAFVIWGLVIRHRRLIRDRIIPFSRDLYANCQTFGLFWVYVKEGRPPNV